MKIFMYFYQRKNKNLRVTILVGAVLTDERYGSHSQDE